MDRKKRLEANIRSNTLEKEVVEKESKYTPHPSKIS